MNQSGIRRATPRQGFTLLELLLTLAVLVAIGLMVFPALEKPFAHQRLLAGADQVRAAWTRARVAAMSSGLVHVFRAQGQTGAFRVEAWADESASLEATSAGGADETTAAAPLKDEQLPDNVQFATAQAAATVRSDLLASSTGAQVATNELPAVFFYPDGTVSDATLLLVNEHGTGVEIHVRGLTGIVTLREPYNVGNEYGTGTTQP